MAVLFRKISINRIKQTAIPRARILLINFDVFRSDLDEDSIIVASATLVEGLLKKDMSSAPTIPPGKLRCSLLDDNKRPLKSVVIDDPMKLEVELPPMSEEDEAHNYISDLDKGSFMIRARFDQAIRHVLVEKADEKGNI